MKKCLAFLLSHIPPVRAHGHEGLGLRLIWQTIKSAGFSTKAWAKNSAAPCKKPLLRRWLGTQGRSKNRVASFKKQLCGRGLGLSLLRGVAWRKTSVDRTGRHPLSAFLWKALTKAGFFSLQGRSKNRVAPFNTPCVRGLGLVEVLVASGVGIIISMASVESLKLTVQSANTVKTSLEQEALSTKVKNFLSSSSQCKSALKPARLSGSDRANQAGLLFKLNPDGTLNSDEPFVPEGLSSGLIEVLGMDLLNEGSNKAHPTRILAVLYKKPFLRGKETVDGEECDPANGEQAGCYFTTCVVDYECSNDECDGEGDRCEPVTCHNGRGFQAVSCPAGQYLQSFSSTGDRECASLPSCPDGKVWTGQFWKAGDSGRPDGVAVGDPKCGPLVALAGSESQRLCPEGQVVQRIEGDGTVECVGFCRERQEWDRDRSPPGCKCAGGREWVQDSCKCPDAKPLWHGSECKSCSEISTATPHYHPIDGECRSCEVSHYYNNQCNPCPRNRWSSLLRRCVTLCGPSGSGKVMVDGHCQCPYDSQDLSRHAYFHNNRCGICPSRQWWNSTFSAGINNFGFAGTNQCQTCTGGTVTRLSSSDGTWYWDCVCPSDEPRRVNNSSNQSSRICMACPDRSTYNPNYIGTDTQPGGYRYPRRTRNQQGYAIKGKCECRGGRVV